MHAWIDIYAIVVSVWLLIVGIYAWRASEDREEACRLLEQYEVDLMVIRRDRDAIRDELSRWRPRRDARGHFVRNG